MYLENVVIDAREPQALGRFWEAALGAETLTDAPGIYETHLSHPGGPELDLCFQQVPEAPADPQRLHLDLRGGPEQQQVVDRLLGLGAERVDIGQGDAPWVVLADPEGNPFCVVEERAAYADTGPLAALPLDSADPRRDGELWAWLTGWSVTPGDAGGARVLRHPSERGPLLELWPETSPKTAAKNRMHLDLRLEASDDVDAVVSGIAERGGREVHHPDWGDQPWRWFVDGSGNEFCLLPAPG